MKKVPRPDPIVFEHTPRKSLFIQADTELDVSKNELIVTSLHDSRSFFLDEISAVVLICRVALSTAAIHGLLRASVPVVLFDSQGKLLGRMEPIYSQRPNIIEAQALMSDQQRLHLTQRIVWGALRSHRRFLLRSQRERGIKVKEAVQELDWSIKCVFKKSEIEAAAALLGSGLSKYYKALAVVPQNSGWIWTGRDVPIAISLVVVINKLMSFDTQVISAPTDSAGIALKSRSRLP